MINGFILKKICPSLPQAKADTYAAALDTICPKYGINTPDILHEFIANLCEESGEFNRFEENLYYNKPERLMQVWPSRFKSIAEALPYTKNPEKLANKVYDNRKDLGNHQQGDGWVFRGSGPIQATGRTNITKFANYYNAKFSTSFTPEQMADLLRANLEIGIHSACWIFAISFKLIDEAINDEMKAIVKRINGAYIGLSDRMRYLETAKKYIL